MIRTGEEYRESLQDGREVYMNGEKIADPARKLGAGDVLPNGVVVLRGGKKNFHLVRVSA